MRENDDRQQWLIDLVIEKFKIWRPVKQKIQMGENYLFFIA